MRYLCALLLLASTLANGSTLQLSSAETPTPVLELYTSQGCSSCPPAERWLSALKNNPGLWSQMIPLAFHVDYWDYLGWKDPFANPAYSARQRAYNRTGGSSSVYTPGFIVAGKEWRGWFQQQPLQLPAQQQTVGKLQLSLEGDSVELTLNPKQPAPAGLTAYVARLGFGLETPITGGENAGETITHDFVVLSLQQVSSDRSNHWKTQLHADQSGQRQAIVAWLGAPGMPAPYQAVGGWISP